MLRQTAHEKSSKRKGEELESVDPAPVVCRPVDRSNTAHYTWGTGCDGWHLVKDEQLSVIEELMPPGTAETRHYHQRAQQFFYVLSGELLIEIEGRNTLVEAGSGMRVLPGQRHLVRNPVRNPASGPTRFLVISQPPSHGDRMNE